ncbi:MAG: efflux RND transporter periplasmic adaptor subunit [Pseudomonadota bacterium]|nr:efflux RND transporter periplasmic adaptor subunit [Pseudomonadota bacterium]
MSPRKIPKKWLFFVPLAAGLAVFVLLTRQNAPPQQREIDAPARAVRYIEAPVVTLVPLALGYGRVRPVRVWDAVAEVSGRIVEINPRLRKGALLAEDELLVRIDPTEYELAVSQVQADILSAKAQLSEMAVKETNTRASLAIEEEALVLREAEVERKAELVGKGTLSTSEFEQEQRNLLVQRQQVQAQKNALNLLPAERELLDAQLARFQAQLDSVRLDLSRTEIRLPFRARISEVNVEEAQYVREGSSLAKADAIDKAEVEAQIPIARMRALMRSGRTLDFNRMEPGRLPEHVGIQAEVWLRDPSGDVLWDAQFARISDTLDPETRTVGVIVDVDEPYSNVRPGERPPLVKGLFTEVVLRGLPRAERLVIPRHALHEDRVYLIDDGRLVIRPVEVKNLQPEYAVIASGLEPGAKVIVSDLVPAIDGMRLEGQPDPKVLERLIASAEARD